MDIPHDESRTDANKQPANDIEHLKLSVDMWKTAISVQQHFNSIEMQIRNIAVTVLAAVLGATGLALKDPSSIAVLGGKINTASWLLFTGLIVWFAFYLMDRLWYHRLLKGSVAQARTIEKMLREEFPAIMLSTSIGEASPLRFPGGWEMHSDRKIDLFYGIVAILLIIGFFATAN